MIRIIKGTFLAFLLVSVSLQADGQSTAEYDQNISKIVNKLHQYPNRTRDLGQLGENYSLALAADQEHVRSLLATGQPDIWPEIYSVYRKMENRQEHLRSLPSGTLEQAGIQLEDLSDPLTESKYRACAYYYAHAEKLLSSGKPAEARTAYAELFQLARITGDYKESDKLIRRAILLGAINIEFELQNRTGKRITTSLADQLARIVWDYRKARGAQSGAEIDDGQPFDFIVRVVLDELTIGPDQIRELQYDEERDILQGDRVVDTIRCSVKEYRQLKKAELKGAIEFFDKQSSQVINRVPLRVESVFTNAYAYLQGDPKAAGEVTRKLLSASKAAYPSESQMILDAAEEFARQASEVILAE